MFFQSAHTHKELLKILMNRDHNWVEEIKFHFHSLMDEKQIDKDSKIATSDTGYHRRRRRRHNESNLILNGFFIFKKKTEMITPTERSQRIHDLALMWPSYKHFTIVNYHTRVVIWASFSSVQPESRNLRL